MMNSSIRIEGINKRYDDILALKNISFDVAKNELFGLIGPNGAGKTTLFRILTSLLLPDNGSASMEGIDVIKDYKKIRSMVGYMPGRFSLYQDLTVEENLQFFATVFGTTIKENYDLIRDIYVQIEPFKKRKTGDLSGGMKQKLALSCALIHKPDVLILDEPTTGVDAVSRKEFWIMLKELKNKGITILVATPYMDEASLCDRVALIQKGQILQIDKPKTIIDEFNKKIFNIQAESSYNLIQDLRKYEDTYSAYLFGQYVHYIDKKSSYETIKLKEYLVKAGHTSIEIEQIKPTIEDVFMDLM